MDVTVSPAQRIRAASASAVAVILALVATVLPAAPAAAGIPKFSDVPEDHQFYTEITWLADQRITTGYANGSFKPREHMSREAFAAFLYRLSDSPPVKLPKKSPFKDVPTNSQFYREIVWLSQQGITTGWSDGTFRPHALIYRDALAAFLYRFAGRPAFTPPNKSPFTDVKTSSKFYKEIAWLTSTGVAKGYGQLYKPDWYVSREAAAAFLYRGNTIAQSGAYLGGDVTWNIDSWVTIVRQVGSQIPPGIYTMVPSAPTDGRERLCYWERRATESGGGSEAIYSWDITPNRAIVEILPTDSYFLKRGCSGMTPLRAVSPNASKFGPGDNAVGYHMRPGTYRAPGGSKCTWVKASDFTWEASSYLDGSTAPTTNPQVQMSTGQAFFSYGCGTWTRIGN